MGLKVAFVTLQVKTYKKEDLLLLGSLHYGIITMTYLYFHYTIFFYYIGWWLILRGQTMFGEEVDIPSFRTVLKIIITITRKHKTRVTLYYFPSFYLWREKRKRKRTFKMKQNDKDNNFWFGGKSSSNFN